MPTHTVGQKIQILRKKLNLSQADLARKVGVAPVTVSKWEIETSKPKGASLLSLSELFNVPMDVLISDHTPIHKIREQVRVPFYADTHISSAPLLTGEPSSEEVYLIDKYYIENPATTIAVSVSGDSMVPAFLDGAVAFVDTKKCTVSDGKVYVVIHEGLTRIKLLEKIPSGLRLKSFNVNYPPEDVFFDKETIKVVGQVVAQIQKY